MQQTVAELIKSHRSIRKYTEEPIADEVLREILTAAQWAPSTHNIQPYSIVVVKDDQTKAKLAALCSNQKWVGNCQVFLVFCADYYRLEKACRMHGTSPEINEVENLIVGAVDTALAAENALITARSFGLGGVMIGGIRIKPEAVAELLRLPRLVIPIMGMCLGYPADDPWQKPRLPQKIVVHQEVYREDMAEGLREYEAISADYYTRRTQGQRTDGWTKQVSEFLSTPHRPNLKKFINDQGMELT